MAKHSVADDGDPRKYYAAIPNLIFNLGLNVYELALYMYFKKVAGESGKCWKSTATIAKEMRIGAGTVSRTKASLAEPRTALGGKALIVIATEMQNGGNENHAITITDIWPENMAELSRLQSTKATRSTGERARSRLEGARSTHEGDAFHTGTKEEPLKNNPEEERRGHPFHHFAVVEYTQTLNPEPPLAIRQAEVIALSVPDTLIARALWTKTLRTFKGNGYHARHAGNAVDRFLSELAEIEAGKRDAPVAPTRTKTIRERMAAR